MQPSSDETTHVPWDRFERFISQFTHDLRNGLNALELQLTFLGEISTDPEAVEEIKHLRASLGDVTRQLQAIKTATGPIKPNLLEYPANDLFEDLRERLTKLLPDTAKTIAWHLADDPAVSLCVDPDLTLGALIELFRNAARFGGTSLRCATTNGVDAVAFVLQETPAAAPALPVEQWGRAPLFSSQRGAYGLGLFRAGRIIEAQDGAMRAEYNPNHNLLTTTVSLPRTNVAHGR